jgi:hypothetical protein
MTDHITLPRAVVEQVREAFKELDYASEPYVNEIARTALAALDAALAEPGAKREPATDEQIIESHLHDDHRFLLSRWDYFHKAWRAAERFHGIRKEDGK